MNLRPTFEKLYPEGSWGGQCAAFAHKLVDFPLIGDYLPGKKAAAKIYGIPLSEARPGDVVVTSESLIFGHAAVINADLGDRWQLTESNYKLNFRVHHNRTISKTSPKILGVINGTPLYSMPVIGKKLTILMNFPKAWESNEEIQKVFDWFRTGNIDFTTNSGIIYTAFTNLPIEYAGSGLGDGFYPQINETWYEQNVLPLRLPNTDLTVLVLPTSVFPGDIFNRPGWVEKGAFYGNQPCKCLCIADEHVASRNFPQYSSMFDYLRHELAHWLYRIASKDGFDHCHQHYQNNEMEKIFNDLDYSKL